MIFKDTAGPKMGFSMGVEGFSSFKLNFFFFFFYSILVFYHPLFSSRPIILSVVDLNSSLYTQVCKNCTFLDLLYPILISLSRSHFSRVAIQGFPLPIPGMHAHSKGIKCGVNHVLGAGQQPLLRPGPQQEWSCWFSWSSCSHLVRMQLVDWLL